jgi:signal transduction histidine kinase
MICHYILSSKTLSLQITLKTARTLILVTWLVFSFLPALAEDLPPDKVQLLADERAWLAQDHVVRVRVGHYPPLMFVEDSKVEGIAIDYLEKIFKMHGIRYKYVLGTEVSWKESLQYMRDHDVVDMVPTAKITEERKAYLAFSSEYLFMPWVIFTREDSPFIGGIEDLAGKTVSVPEGYVMQTLLKENYPEINQLVLNGPGKMETCIKSLSCGKVDAFIGNLTLGSFFISNHGYTNLKVSAPTPFDNHNQAMAMRNDWPELASIISKTLNVIPPGEKTDIINKWMSVRYEHGLEPLDIIKWVGGVSVVSLLIVSAIMIWNRRLRSEILARTAAEDKLKHANAELDAYVHMVSHDLRTPLVPIMGYVEIILNHYSDRLDDRARNYLKEIEGAGHRMEMLIDELLSLATVGTVDKPLTQQDAEQIARKVVDDLFANLAAEGARVELGLLPPALIHRVHLEQIFINLIGNAVKYAGQRGGVIEVSGQRQGKSVRFLVRDHGVGIPLMEQEKVFDLFFQGSLNQGVQGTGIGLATVKKIADFYQGRAWVEETPGGGCTFFVELVDSPALKS